METDEIHIIADEGKIQPQIYQEEGNVLAASERSLETSNEKQQQQLQQNGGGTEEGENRPRKKHRRGRGGAKKKVRHKYKPYNKLTWDEKRKLDEKDAEKAVRKRKELVAQKGRPIAPYLSLIHI